MKMKTKLIILLCPLLSVCMLFSGCGSPSYENKTSAPSADNGGEQSALAERIDSLPAEEQRIAAEKSGTTYISFYKMNWREYVEGSQSFYRIDGLPALDSRSFLEDDKTQSKEGVTFGVCALRSGDSIGAEEYVVSDPGVFRNFEDTVLSLTYAETDQKPDAPGAVCYTVDLSGARADYRILTDGRVFRTVEEKTELSGSSLSKSDAAYFWALAMTYGGVVKGTTNVSFIPDGTVDHLRFYVEKDGKTKLLDVGQSKQLSDLLCGEGGKTFKAYVTSGISDQLEKTELFRFYPFSDANTIADPPADERLWYRFYTDGTVSQVLWSGSQHTLDYPEDYCTIYCCVVRTNAESCSPKKAQEVIGSFDGAE